MKRRELLTNLVLIFIGLILALIAVRGEIHSLTIPFEGRVLLLLVGGLLWTWSAMPFHPVYWFRFRWPRRK